MHSYYYLLFNLLVFVPVLILSFTTDVKPHRHLKALLGAFLLVCVPFILWDAWAVHAGHWGFNSNYVLSPRFINLALEEILFFITVPFAMIYVWGVIRKFVDDVQIKTWIPLALLSLAAGAAGALLVWYWDRGYTRAAMIAALIAVIVAGCSTLVFTLRFWVFQVVLLLLFLIANWVLTALPIILYSNAEIIGTKILTIPLEDFFFNFALINLFLITYNWLDSRLHIAR
ncbi:MAG: lycopene cyclase domain-containing protein [Candidatus Saccharimonadales bacterium]